MAADDLDALLTSLVSLPECLGDLRNHAISHNPLQLLLGGLVGESEISQIALQPRPIHQQ